MGKSEWKKSEKVTVLLKVDNLSKIMTENLVHYNALNLAAGCLVKNGRQNKLVAAASF